MATFGLQSFDEKREGTHWRAEAQPVSRRTHWRLWPLTVMGTRIPHGRSWRGRVSTEGGGVAKYRGGGVSVRIRSLRSLKSSCTACSQKKSAPSNPSIGRWQE